MTTQRDDYLDKVRSLRSDMAGLLEGMDYCLDWKASDDDWSAREVVCHLLDTPAGGVHAALEQILQGSSQEIVIVSSLTNLTPERKGKDLADLHGDVESLLERVELALMAINDVELGTKTAPVHLTSADTHEDRTAGRLLERTLLGHWREHMDQISEIRQALGFE